jgi:hypothetical protein
VQCRPLAELDWQRFGFDEIHLIVCRPIQAEIDRQKNKGGDRVARRARKGSSVFREIILSEDGNKTVRASKPTVRLLIEPQLRPADGISIDYSQADDQLVGIAAEYSRQHPSADVRVLTHDTGPMATARSIGVGLAPIPDEWLQAPEQSEAEKIIKSKDEEIARLKSAEPKIHISVAGIDESDSVLRGEVIYYEPLTSSEIAQQIERIRKSLPLATEFNSSRPTTQNPTFLVRALQDVYEPSSEQEIGKYRSEYSSWLVQCEKVLKTFHSWMQQRRTDDTRFRFNATNQGTRPARDVLVTISVEGNFEILPTEERPDDEGFSLPAPPKPPLGIWGPAGFAQLEKLTRRGFLTPRTEELRGLADTLRPPRPRDPNAFYWKRKPSVSTNEFVFECAQWRHGGKTEGFAGEIWFDPSQPQVTGVLECTVQADNLSSAERLKVPVRMAVERRSILDAARNAVDMLILFQGGDPA